MTTTQTTRTDVERAVARHREVLVTNGLVHPSVTFTLTKGSRTNGIPWSLRCAGGSRPPVGDPVLGWTAREAYDAIVTRTSLVLDVLVLRGERAS